MNKSIRELKFSRSVFLALGLVGSVIVGIGEYLLHFAPEGPAGEVTMLLNVPIERARIGHFFAVVGVPFYFAGYYGMLKLFKNSSLVYSKILFVLGVMSFTVGGIWISSRYFGAVVLQKSQNTEMFEYFMAQYDQNYQVLVWALRVFVLLLSLFYVLCVLKSKIIPRWAAIFNPCLLYTSDAADE